MELSAFVAETLTQIVRGVVDSSAEISAMGGAVSPAYYFGDQATHLGKANADSSPVHAIHFDVLVTVSEGTSEDTKEVLSVAAAELGNATTAAKQAERSSRIRFVVPLQLPTDPKSLSDAQAARTAARRSFRKSVSAMAA